MEKIENLEKLIEINTNLYRDQEKQLVITGENYLEIRDAHGQLEIQNLKNTL
jgi:hypothetical protein